MIVITAQSGSNGNAIYVESAGVALVIDAGISGVQARTRLAALGVDIRQAAALLISHDHSDHVHAAGVYHRQFGLPLYMTAATHRAAQRSVGLGQLREVRHFRAGETLSFGPLRVETVPTPHDGVDGAAFVIDDGRVRLGVLTDLGHVFAGLAEVLASLDGVLLESNYDPTMLDKGPYPPRLKARIRGDGGHLSNAESAALLAGLPAGRLRWACLAHLSAHNNTPEVALATHQERLEGRLPLTIASRHVASGPMELQA